MNRDIVSYYSELEGEQRQAQLDALNEMLAVVNRSQEELGYPQTKTKQRNPCLEIEILSLYNRKDWGNHNR